MIKEQIINTAFDLFSQYGIKSVSMDDVAKAAGISKRTLYESFEDKETLLIEGSRSQFRIARTISDGTGKKNLSMPWK